MMPETYDVIWKTGDAEMPAKAKAVVDSARDELVLRALHLPEQTENQLRYNSDKNHQSVADYITGIISQKLAAA
jgi:hypothetical protein